MIGGWLGGVGDWRLVGQRRRQRVIGQRTILSVQVLPSEGEYLNVDSVLQEYLLAFTYS